MGFLPDKYKVPSSSDKYMKLQQGDNKLRILSNPVLGNEYWVDGEDGRKPVRKRMGENIVLEEVPEPDKIRHFWAMVVFDYSDQKIKILEITQKRIMQSIQGLYGDEDWGDPTGSRGYDLSIKKEGEGRETKYEVNPKPRKELPDGVMQLYKDMNINLESLYDGGDPFNSGGTTGKDKVNIDDIPL